jgi:hypothetical protein
MSAAARVPALGALALVRLLTRKGGRCRMSANLVWLLLFIVAWAVVFLVIPRDRLVSLLLPSFLGGAVIALIINLIGVPVMGLWRFMPTPVMLLGIPMFLLLAHMGEMLLFLHYWDYLPGGSAEKGLYVIGSSLVITGVAFLTLLMGYVSFINWNLLYFLVTIFAGHVLGLLAYSMPGIHEVRD